MRKICAFDFAGETKKIVIMETGTLWDFFTSQLGEIDLHSFSSFKKSLCG